MKIIDINGKERNVVSIRKIVHQVPDAISGEMVSEDFVEILMKGQYRPDWKEWVPYEKFKELNPNVEVKAY